MIMKYMIKMFQENYMCCIIPYILLIDFNFTEILK